MIAEMIAKWQLKRATKQLELEKQHIQALCNHEFEYAGDKLTKDHGWIDVDIYYEYYAVCKHCSKEISDKNKRNLETVINISKIRHSKEN